MPLASVYQFQWGIIRERNTIRNFHDIRINANCFSKSSSRSIRKFATKMESNKTMDFNKAKFERVRSLMEGFQEEKNQQRQFSIFSAKFHGNSLKN